MFSKFIRKKSTITENQNSRQFCKSLNLYLESFKRSQCLNMNLNYYTLNTSAIETGTEEYFCGQSCILVFITSAGCVMAEANTPDTTPQPKFIGADETFSRTAKKLKKKKNLIIN